LAVASAVVSTVAVIPSERAGGPRLGRPGSPRAERGIPEPVEGLGSIRRNRGNRTDHACAWTRPRQGTKESPAATRRPRIRETSSPRATASKRRQVGQRPRNQPPRPPAARVGGSSRPLRHGVGHRWVPVAPGRAPCASDGSPHASLMVARGRKDLAAVVQDTGFS
jgi:hypothetical protein